MSYGRRSISIFLIAATFAGIMAGAAAAGLEDDLVGTWSMVMEDTGATVTFVFREDGTYSMVVTFSVMTLLSVAGTYEVKDTDVIYTITESSDPTQVGETDTIRAVSIAGDWLIATSSDDEQLLLSRGEAETPVVSGAATISGRVTYTGTASYARIIVFAARPEEMTIEEIPPSFAMLTEPGEYTLENVPPGAYMVGAFLDVGGSEPVEMGVYGGTMTPTTVSIASGANLTGIDIAIDTPVPPTAVRGNSWGRIKRGVSSRE